MVTTFFSRAAKILADLPHPKRGYLLQILTGRTSLSSSGFPYISERSFRSFLAHIPHLFADGKLLQSWLTQVEKRVDKTKEFSQTERESFFRALQVLRTVIYSAAVCAPPDLWILRHVLSVHSQLGITRLISTGAEINADELAEKLQLDPKHLSCDLSLLHSRGYLQPTRKGYVIADSKQAADIFRNITPIPIQFLRDMVDPLLTILTTPRTKSDTKELVSFFLNYSGPQRKSKGWFASRYDLQVGYRLVPLVLALHSMKITKHLEEGSNLLKVVPRLTAEMIQLLFNAGMIEKNIRLTSLGLRVLQRAPGPFGIIHAYTPYMQVLNDKLTRKGSQTWVHRGKNIAASQDANRKTFEMANDSFDQFCKDHNFHCSIFIEHALGQGEATRQRLQREGENHIQYFGADLEDAAIDKAEELQRQGVLPKNMIFIRKADIANPQIVIDAVKHAGFSTQNSVMFVGNGFHEVRSQTNQKIVDVFRQYCDAGILVIFTEESALSDYDLGRTGWNTYHAGFRYVHELSGQGLRPVFGTDRFGRHSWRICAALGGYAVLSKYCEHTRTIYPFPKKGGYNPPISMTYFCVPDALARNLGYFPRDWSSIR
jgi:hypothetical protein